MKTNYKYAGYVAHLMRNGALPNNNANSFYQAMCIYVPTDELIQVVDVANFISIKKNEPFYRSLYREFYESIKQTGYSHKLKAFDRQLFSGLFSDGLTIDEMNALDEIEIMYKEKNNTVKNIFEFYGVGQPKNAQKLFFTVFGKKGRQGKRSADKLSVNPAK